MENNWVSVDDKLPTDGELVLLCIEYDEDNSSQSTGCIECGSEGMQWRIGNDYFAWDHNFNIGIAFESVTHWQELPVLPNEG